MKKLFIFPLLFLFSSIVYADELLLSNYSSFYDDNISFYLEHQTEINQVLNIYQSNFSSSYPYFYLKVIPFPDSDRFAISLTYGSSNILNSDLSFSDYDGHNSLIYYYSNGYDGQNPALCYSSHWSLEDNCTIGTYVSSAYYLETNSYIPLMSNNLVFSSYSNYDTLTFSSFTSSTYDTSVISFSVSNGDYLPNYISFYNGSYYPSIDYTEINLNNYSYVALSLKDYNTSSFSTDFLVKGQLCLTPVYDYGMKNKSDYYSGYKVQGCSPVYNSFTPVSIYILQQDLQNHSIYYLKAYDTLIDNIVKVDTSIFDITYINSANENNPSVVIGGRSYPTIPYNDLTSSSTDSETEGYISGNSQNIFDVSTDSNFISSLFQNPLQAMSTIWSSILTMFTLVGSFIGLLPTTLQTFLFSAFSLALVLGLIKIIIS